MKVHIVREKQQTNQSYQGKYRRFRSDPKLLMWAGVIIAVFSAVAYFAVQIIFSILGVFGVLIFLWGAIVWISRLFQR